MERAKLTQECNQKRNEARLSGAEYDYVVYAGQVVLRNMIQTMKHNWHPQGDPLSLIIPNSKSILNLQKNKNSAKKFFSKGIKGALVNIRSVNNKLDEIETHLHIANWDFICFTETWAQTDIPFNDSIQKNFSILQTNRLNKKGGGCALLLKKI